MLKSIIILLGNLLLFISNCEAILCYHCYDSSESALTLGTLNKTVLGEKFVRCDKNKNNWNSWDCPAHWPVCIVMSGTVKDHLEVVRSCAEKDFCSKYKPPNGIKIDYCRECNTTLCNDYLHSPDPPVGPGPLFTFNININLNVKQHLALSKFSSKNAN